MWGFVVGVPRGRGVRFREEPRRRDWMLARMQAAWIIVSWTFGGTWWTDCCGLLAA